MVLCAAALSCRSSGGARDPGPGPDAASITDTGTASDAGSGSGERPDTVLARHDASDDGGAGEAAGGRPSAGAGGSAGHGGTAGAGGAPGAGGHEERVAIGAPFAVARFVSPFPPAALTELVDLNGDQAPELVSTVGENIVVSFFERGAFRASSMSAIGSVSGGALPSLGDLNADGRTDAIVTGTQDGLDHVLLGRGDGSFVATSARRLVTTQTGSATEIAIVDLNGDRFGDLLALDSSYIGPGVQFTVRLGNGDGTFGPATKCLSDSYAWPMLLADLDGNDRPDLVVGDTFFLNDGAGRFGPQAQLPDAWILGIADLNGDGRPDLIGQAGSRRSGGLRIFFNQGGKFATAVTYLEGRLVTRVEVADLDGDMRPDLVVGTGSPGDSAFSPDDGVFILLNRESGFAQSVRYLPGTFGYSWADGREWLEVGDLNGDGRPDIVAKRDVVEFPASDVEVLFNLGDGSFADPVILAGTGRPMAIFDLDRDGDADIVAENGTVLFANADRARLAQIGAVPLTDGPISLRLLDLDGDGALDVLFRGAEALGSIRGYGDGTLDPVVIIADRLGSANIGVSDMNGDGTPDIAVALGGPAGGVDILLNDGQGRFATRTEFPTAPYADGVAVGDFDEDGDVDLATPAVGGFSVLLNDGRGQFSSHVEYDLGSTPRSLTAIDVDGDGRSDLVLDVKDGVYQIIRNDGSGRLTPEAPIDFVGRTLAWVDLTGDGLPDHVVGPLLEEVSSALTIFPNDGGTFGPGARADAPGLVLPIGDVVAGDLNGDGWSDLVLLNRRFQGPPYAALLMADGTGAFSVDDIYAVPGYALALGDLTGDGRLDLVVGYQDRVCVFANLNDRR
jgi:hypothetical protein